MRILLAVLTCVAVSITPADAAKRDRTQRAAFQRSNPCPATGKTRGACPGYQVDHIRALVCGGTDTPDNMQWLEIEPHKHKTRSDVRACRVHMN